MTPVRRIPGRVAVDDDEVARLRLHVALRLHGFLLTRRPDGPTLPPGALPRIGESAEPGSANYGRAVLSRARIGALPDAAAALGDDAVAMDNVATLARGEEPTMSATIGADAHVSEANRIFSRVLVGVDGSPESYDAARQAALLKAPGGTITCLAAWNLEPPLVTPMTVVPRATGRSTQPGSSPRRPLGWRRRTSRRPRRSSCTASRGMRCSTRSRTTRRPSSRSARMASAAPRGSCSAPPPLCSCTTLLLGPAHARGDRDAAAPDRGRGRRLA